DPAGHDQLDQLEQAGDQQDEGEHREPEEEWHQDLTEYVTVHDLAHGRGVSDDPPADNPKPGGGAARRLRGERRARAGAQRRAGRSALPRTGAARGRALRRRSRTRGAGRGGGPPGARPAGRLAPPPRRGASGWSDPRPGAGRRSRTWSLPRARRWWQAGRVGGSGRSSTGPATSRPPAPWRRESSRSTSGWRSRSRSTS